ncbi:CDP-glycerol glycerophosphotransferase family protein [Aeromonas sp. S13(2024)]|uniref:CDP-glycerol glycerophosphotransferase family protein n=1 Tax=Aeromonas TaxID=642 RepID=UPI0035282713
MLSINNIEQNNSNGFIISARLNDGLQNRSVKLLATKNNKQLEIGRLFFKKNKAKCNLNNVELLEKGIYQLNAISSAGNLIDVSFTGSNILSTLHCNTSIISLNQESQSLEVTPISNLTSKVIVDNISDDENNLYVTIRSNLSSTYKVKGISARHRINNIEEDSLPLEPGYDDECKFIFPKRYSFSKSGIWDFYIKVESCGIDSFIRLNACVENLCLHNINCFYDNKLFKFQPYITQDGQLSLNVRDLTTTFSKQESIIYTKKSFIVKVKVSESYLGLYKNIKARLVSSEGEQISISVKSKKNGILEVNLPFDLFVNLTASNRGNVGFNWELTLKNGEVHSLPVSHMLDEDHVKSCDVLIYPPATYECDNNAINLRPFFNAAHNLLFSVDQECKLAIKNIFLREKIEIHLDGDLKDHNISLIAISGKDGSTIHFERQNGVYISTVNISELPTCDNAYFLHYIKDNVKVIINNVFPSVKDKFKTFKKNRVSLSGNTYLSCVVCKKSLASIEIRPLREHERNLSKLSLFVAKLTAAAVKRITDKDIWLIGENLGDVAQDNGFAFFKHVLSLNNEKVYYVIRKESVHYHKLIPFKNNVLIYDSFKHKVLYHLASKLIVAHGIRDVLPSIKHPVIYRNDKDIVYLQHGVLAMKRIGMSGASYNNRITKFVVSSENEKKIMIRDSKFRADQILVSGLPRFDDLHCYSEKPKRQIFIMPTWRDWLVNSEQGFIESEFFKNYKRLLSDEALDEFLQKNNYVIKVLPHNEIYKKYIHHFSSSCKNILIADLSKETVQALIRESSGMVTDYSSVAWDFLFMQKPTLFFQFDVNEYLAKRGAYVSFQSNLPGQICYSYDNFTECLKSMIEKDCKFESRHLSKLKMFINNIDSKNCHRVYEEISTSAKGK